MRFALRILKSQNTKRDNQIMFALCALIFLPAINNFLNTILQKKMNIDIPILTPAIYIFMALLSLAILYRQAIKRKVFIFIFFFFLITVVLSYMLYPKIRTVIYSSPVDLVYSPVNKLFFFCLPALGGAMCLSDWKALFEKMRVWGIITLIIGSLSYYLVFFVAGQALQYMVFSYFMLVPICVCFEYAKAKKTKFELILAIIGSVCIFMCGARGACLSLILYFVLRVLCGDIKRVSVKGLAKFFVLFVIGVAMLVGYQEILTVVADVLEELGVDSRFIVKLIEGDLIEDSARSEITDAIWSGLKNNPLGYGLFGDRYVTGTFGYGSYIYAHNIITELLCDFGFTIGSLLLVMLFWRIVKTIIISRRREESSLLLILLPYGLFQLFFSSSFLENVAFFVIMGLCIGISWRSRVCEQEEADDEKQNDESLECVRNENM